MKKVNKFLINLNDPYLFGVIESYTLDFIFGLDLFEQARPVKKRGRSIQSNIQASVVDVIAARMNDEELGAATPLLGLDRVQEFRSPADLSGYRYRILECLVL